MSEPLNDEGIEQIKRTYGYFPEESQMGVIKIAEGDFVALIATVEHKKKVLLAQCKLNTTAIEAMKCAEHNLVVKEKEVESLKKEYSKNIADLQGRIKDTNVVIVQVSEENAKLETELDAALKRIEEIE